APIVERAGLRHVPLGPAALAPIRDQVLGAADAVNAVGRDRGLLMYREAFGRRIATAMADDVLALTADLRPDVLVHEDLELGGWIAAERRGIPHVTIQATAWRPANRVLVIEHLDEIRARLDLPPDPDLAGGFGAALWFTTRPPALRDPSRPMPPGFRELRPDPDDRAGGDVPQSAIWLAGRPDRPRIAVTLGTVNGHRLDLLRPIVEGLAELDVEVVVALGADPSTLGPVGDRVRVEPYVPMSDLLPRSTVVVHHAGSGTVLAALAAGVPSALVPIAADQHDNADAVARAGAGLILDSADLTAASVAATVRTLLDDPVWAVRSRAVGAEIAAMPDATAALREIEAVAAAGRPDT
ncbi:MAG: glycosyltransferase, partial [Candidatus Limnocylindrales bacterium]